MIEPQWRRIAGLCCQEDGEIAAVWLAHDRETDCVHVYDCALFRREVLAVVAEGLNARGRWIPIAWEAAAQEVADKLLERGCRMLVDPVKDSERMAEVVSRDIEERMRSGRFKVEKRLGEWWAEFNAFARKDAKVPRAGYPLMSATRAAMALLDEARRQAPRRKQAERRYPKVAIL